VSIFRVFVSILFKIMLGLRGALNDMNAGVLS